MFNLKKVMLTLAIACSAISFSAQGKITVFAAASMTNALQQIADEYSKQQANQAENPISFSFASSSTLARQITEGAPADLFVSADQKWMDFLAEKKAIDESTRFNLAGNILVMIAPANSKIEKVDLSNDKWHDHLAGNFLAVGDPEHVPAGIYAKTAFTHLKQWDALEKRLARTDNVRKALLLVEKGEAPLGVVYQTDAAASNGKVKIVAVFPADSHKPVEYPVALIKDRNNAETKAFLDYLKTDTAKNILKQQGFLVK